MSYVMRSKQKFYSFMKRKFEKAKANGTNQMDKRKMLYFMQWYYEKGKLCVCVCVCLCGNRGYIPPNNCYLLIIRTEVMGEAVPTVSTLIILIALKLIASVSLSTMAFVALQWHDGRFWLLGILWTYDSWIMMHAHSNITRRIFLSDLCTLISTI